MYAGSPAQKHVQDGHHSSAGWPLHASRSVLVGCGPGVPDALTPQEKTQMGISACISPIFKCMHLT